MKNISILFLSFSVMVLFTQCNSPAPEKLCDNTATRGKIISELMSNDDYMNEVMDSGIAMNLIYDKLILWLRHS